MGPAADCTRRYAVWRYWFMVSCFSFSPCTLPSNVHSKPTTDTPKVPYLRQAGLKGTVAPACRNIGERCLVYVLLDFGTWVLNFHPYVLACKPQT